MSRLIATIGFVALAATANGQGLVTQRNLSLPIAKTIAEAALAACKEKGFRTAVAVVDRAGKVMVILRDEQAEPKTVEMARRKAYTARMFRSSTVEFQKRTADPAYAAQRDLPDILALGGGVPIQAGGDTIGGVASSGQGRSKMMPALRPASRRSRRCEVTTCRRRAV